MIKQYKDNYKAVGRPRAGKISKTALVLTNGALAQLSKVKSQLIQSEVIGNQWQVCARGNVDNKSPQGKALSLVN